MKLSSPRMKPLRGAALGNKISPRAFRISERNRGLPLNVPEGQKMNSRGRSPRYYEREHSTPPGEWRLGKA